MSFCSSQLMSSVAAFAKMSKAMLLLYLLMLMGCGRSGEKLAEGPWRGTLRTESGTQIPFNFELKTSGEKIKCYLINAEERFEADEVALTSDSVTIKFSLYDSEIRARIGDSLTGFWIKRSAEKVTRMEFSAKQGNIPRFGNTASPLANVSGRWDVSFVKKQGTDTSKVVGEFKQNGEKVSGTFLTPTGDYRFLEGVVSGKELSLSSFDGSQAYLFTAQLGDGTLSSGKIYAGYSTVNSWFGKRDSAAELPDAYSLTTLKGDEKRLDFSFPDLEGKKVSLSDARFRNKVVVVQFLGSWCPNCLDETKYLTSFYDRFNKKGVEIIGLAYELTNDNARSNKQVSRLKERFNIKYSLLITGYTNKEVLKGMPQLQNFKAFPTTIIVDKKGLVRKIHTGFSGPGTGEHYTEFVNQFEAEITKLINEP